MASPFPGMDPYLEASGAWMGFHHALVTHLHDELNQRLPDHYAAIIDERVQLVDLDEGTGRERRPDVGVIREDAPRRTSPPNGGVATLTEVEPVTLTTRRYEPDTQGYVNVIRLPEHELVTSIEILSPSNKVSPGSGEYLMKQRAMRAQGVNLVEIDLLLEGKRFEFVETLPTGDFFAFVSRASQHPRCDVYGWSIRHRLPKIPIPLRPPDADISLDLASLVALTYERGRYSRSMPYASAINLAISEADREWVKQLLIGRPA